MSDDDEGQAAWSASYDAAMKDFARLQDALTASGCPPDMMNEVMQMALCRLSDPATAARQAREIDERHANAQMELARHKAERQQQHAKLKAAFDNVMEKMQPGAEKRNYLVALMSMMKRYERW
jgi:hypothetical protein